MEEQIAATLIRLINERPVKRWYLKKDQFDQSVSWIDVMMIVRSQGYQCEDQGTVIKGWV